MKLWSLVLVPLLALMLLGSLSAQMARYDSPSRYSLRAHCPPVRDANGEGACAAIAVEYNLEYLYKQHGVPVRLSSRVLYWNGRGYDGETSRIDDGMSIMAAMLTACTGCVTEDECPDNEYLVNVKPPVVDGPYKAKGVMSVPPNLSLIKSYIARGTPVCVIFGYPKYCNVEEMVFTHITGLFPQPTPIIDGYHMVMLVGYNDRTRLLEVENDWGTNFGGKGFGWLPYDYFPKHSLGGFVIQDVSMDTIKEK